MEQSRWQSLIPGRGGCIPYPASRPVLRRRSAAVSG